MNRLKKITGAHHNITQQSIWLNWSSLDISGLGYAQVASVF